MTRLQQGLATGGMGPDRHFAEQQSPGPNVRFGSKADIGTAQLDPLYPRKRTSVDFVCLARSRERNGVSEVEEHGTIVTRV